MPATTGHHRPPWLLSSHQSAPRARAASAGRGSSLSARAAYAPPVAARQAAQQAAGGWVPRWQQQRRQRRRLRRCNASSCIGCARCPTHTPTDAPTWLSDQCTTGRTPGGQVASAASSACRSLSPPGQNCGGVAQQGGDAREQGARSAQHRHDGSGWSCSDRHPLTPRSASKPPPRTAPPARLVVVKIKDQGHACERVQEQQVLQREGAGHVIVLHCWGVSHGGGWVGGWVSGWS